MDFLYKVGKDYVLVLIQNEDGKRVATAQIPKKDVDYMAKRAIKELDIAPDEAYDLAVYVTYVRVTWGL